MSDLNTSCNHYRVSSNTGGAAFKHECGLNLGIPCDHCPVGLGQLNENTGLGLVRELLSQRDGWRRQFHETRSLRAQDMSRATADAEKAKDMIDDGQAKVRRLEDKLAGLDDLNDSLAAADSQVAELTVEVEKLEGTYVPQKNVIEMMEMLEGVGYGKPGQPNTLWSMVMRVCADIARFESEGINTAGYESAAMFRDKLEVAKTGLEVIAERGMSIVSSQALMARDTLMRIDEVQSGGAPAETLPGELATARSPLPSSNMTSVVNQTVEEHGLRGACSGVLCSCRICKAFRESEKGESLSEPKLPRNRVVKISWDNRVEIVEMLGSNVPENSPLRHYGPRPETFEVVVPTQQGAVKARSGDWLIVVGFVDSFHVLVDKSSVLDTHRAHVERRMSAGLVNNKANCKIHGEPLVQTHRCEVPENMNGAPRPVCPECLEERAERAEVVIRVLKIEKEETAQTLVELEARVRRLKDGLVATIRNERSSGSMVCMGAADYRLRDVAKEVLVRSKGGFAEPKVEPRLEDALPETPAPTSQRPPEQTPSPPPPRVMEVRQDDDLSVEGVEFLKYRRVDGDCRCQSCHGRDGFPCSHVDMCKSVDL